MGAKVEFVDEILPVGWDDRRDMDGALCRISFSYKRWSLNIFGRALALALDYPYGTEIRSSSGSRFGGLSISIPEKFSPDMNVRFGCFDASVWAYEQMREGSLERYESLLKMAPDLDEVLSETLKNNNRACPPQFYGAYDFFEDRVSGRRSRDFFDMGPWEQSQINMSRLAY